MNDSLEHFQTFVDSPLGALRLMATPAGLAGVWFVDRQRHEPAAKERDQWRKVTSHPVLDETARQLGEYFSGRRQDFQLPMDLQRGTAFQQAVWRALLEVPFGQTTRYGELAQQLGRPLASRAVGASVGRNPLAIVVPCHRVLGATGHLTGYAGGLDRKQALLNLEMHLKD